jgi:uncharacterized protein with von Willebrand factor type A (vWA) domain
MSPDNHEPGAPGAPVRGDLALVAARFGVALRAAGVPADPGRCERFAGAVTVARPDTLRGLYLCALATLASSQDQIETLRRVFWEVFGGPSDLSAAGETPGSPAVPGGHPRTSQVADLLRQAADAARNHTAAPRTDREPEGSPWLAPDEADGGDEDQSPSTGGPSGLIPLDSGAPEGEDAEAARHTLASAVERLASTDFAALTPAELFLLSGLMRRLTLAVPLRRSRRPRRTPHGRQADLRATLRQARRTGGHPLRLARRAPVLEPRRLVVLCDISGSMEPYARAMLQLLYCAAGGAQAEVFTFATRLTRLTGTLAHARPGVALQQAGQTAPDWLGGTRIGESLAEFNDSHGRPGMARGAVVVIISDGWDTGDPAVLQREMERLSRVAHRIIWVNPRTQSPEYQPLAGGMAAAWPFCDAVVSAHSLNALEDLTAALAHSASRRLDPAARRALAGGGG